MFKSDTECSQSSQAKVARFPSLKESSLGHRIVCLEMICLLSSKMLKQFRQVELDRVESTR